MAAVKDIKLTDNPLTNIRIMLPLLDDKARQRFADMMYGCYICEKFLVEKEDGGSSNND